MWKSYKVSAKKVQKSYFSWHWTMMQNLNKPLLCGFKNGIMNWVTFIRALKILQNCTLMGSFCPKHIMFQLENFRGIVSWHLRVLQKLKENWLVAWKINIKNLVNFHVNSRKSENLHFDRMLLSKAYKDLDEKVQKSNVSWHWRGMQSLKKNWLLFPKIT